MPNRRRRSKAAIETPPKAFPVAIKIHVYDESGLNSCLICGRDKDFRLHLRPHAFEVNLDSKLKRCMCGHNQNHLIHTKGPMA